MNAEACNWLAPAFTYNPAVSRRPSSPPPLPVWTRLAAFLSFLAVLSALLAPVSMLAEEVRTGQLGSICGVNAVTSHPGSGSDDLPQAGSPCDLCGMLGLALPPLTASAISCFPGNQLVAVFSLAGLATVVTGLPFSRGPPRL